MSPSDNLYHLIQIVSYDVQSDAWTGSCIFIRALCNSCVEGRNPSSARGDLVVQCTRTKFGGRAFVTAGPVAWNQLPCSVRNSPSVDSFKSALKTFCSLSIFNCTLHLTSICCCMRCMIGHEGDLESITMLTCLRNYRDIIIIIITIIIISKSLKDIDYSIWH